jgi:hypothetical protein
MEEVVEPHANSHLALRRDMREQTASQDDSPRLRIRQTIRSAVQQNKLPQGRVFADVVLKRAEDGERLGPAGVVRLVVPGDEKDGPELPQLAGQEAEAVVLVGRDVADVAEQG